MKALLLLLALGIPCHADQLIYRGVGHQTIFGNGKITHVTTTSYLVIDPMTNKATSVGAFTINGQKLYSVVPLQDHRVDFVAGNGGAVYTVISKAESPGKQFAGTLSEAVYMRGMNSLLRTGPLSTAFFPKTFTSTGRAIVHNDQNGVTVASEVTGSATIDLRATFQGNENGETFDHAVQRYSDYFSSRGYALFVAPPAS